MAINLKHKNIFGLLLGAILILLFANVAGITLKYYFDHDYVFGLIPLFDFNNERNIPTLYSFFLLIFSSVLLSIITYKNRAIGREYMAWAGLAVTFLFLSIDEIYSIHEEFTVPIRETLGISGLFFYAWIIPYAISLVFFVVIYSRFLIKLPIKFAILFVTAGSIFVLGAIGFELLGGLQHSVHGDDNITYCILYTFEELFEMLGISLFVFALTTYLKEQYTTLSLTKTKILRK